MAIEALQYLADEAKESNNSGGLIMPLFYQCKTVSPLFLFLPVCRQGGIWSCEFLKTRKSG